MGDSVAPLPGRVEKPMKSAIVGCGASRYPLDRPIRRARAASPISFRTRLTSFFILIVVVPMLAIGFLGYRLISDSENGKADARAGGLASAAGSLYQSEIASARADARTLARDPALLSAATRHSRLAALAARTGLARATVTADHGTLVDIGDSTAVAPGPATVTHRGGRPLTITVSEITAAESARALTSHGAALVLT